MIRFNFTLLGFYFVNVVILLLISVFIFFHGSFTPNEVGDGMLAQHHPLVFEGKSLISHL